MRGHQPEWFKHIKCAQYLGCSALELADPATPMIWKAWALSGMQAEAEAQRAVQDDVDSAAS